MFYTLIKHFFFAQGPIYVIIEHFLRVYIASSKHEEGWENSRQLRKREKRTRAVAQLFYNIWYCMSLYIMTYNNDIIYNVVVCTSYFHIRYIHGNDLLCQYSKVLFVFVL